MDGGGRENRSTDEYYFRPKCCCVWGIVRKALVGTGHEPKQEKGGLYHERPRFHFLKLPLRALASGKWVRSGRRAPDIDLKTSDRRPAPHFAAGIRINFPPHMGHDVTVIRIKTLVMIPPLVGVRGQTPAICS